jgi:hypothetical protein
MGVRTEGTINKPEMKGFTGVRRELSQDDLFHEGQFIHQLIKKIGSNLKRCRLL